MFQYRFEKLKHVLSELINSQVSAETFEWLKLHASPATSSKFNATFVLVPRKTGRQPVQLSPDDSILIDEARPGFSVDGWAIDRLARVWLLMHVDPSDQDEYIRKIENLFLAAEVNELVALYSALPVFAYPERWKARCAEGIRSNIADVLSAIMCNNPYPAENLDEAAWNQLVLKAFFTDKPIDEIIGIDLRTNRNLARTLSDYAHERWAAHRSVNPQLWRCVSPFLDDLIIEDIKKVLSSENIIEREAGALAAYWSPAEKAKGLISEELKKHIETGELTWQLLAEKTKNYVLQ